MNTTKLLHNILILLISTHTNLWHLREADQPDQCTETAQRRGRQRKYNVVPLSRWKYIKQKANIINCPSYISTDCNEFVKSSYHYY